MPSIAEYAAFLQRELFPRLEQEEVGPLSRLDEQFCQVMSLTELGRFAAPYEWCGKGRPPKERLWLAHAFIAKAVYQFPTTAALIEALKARPTLRRLCGYEKTGDIPSEPTFSRAFGEFAEGELPQRIHEHLVKTHVGPSLVGHISRDSTAIEAPERPAPKARPAQPASPKKRGRPRRGEERPAPEPKRLDLQGTRTLEENLADLPKPCTAGCKRNSKGHTESWIGYKLHIDANDWGVPVSVILTSASLHDSQAAIPLAQMSAERVTSLYGLMDSAYDCPQIHAFIRGQGQVPIIDPNPRRGEVSPLPPAEAQRFKERSTVERVNSLLKERYGARWVRVRGSLEGLLPSDVWRDRSDGKHALCPALLRRSAPQPIAISRVHQIERASRRAQKPLPRPSKTGKASRIRAFPTLTRLPPSLMGSFSRASAMPQFRFERTSF